LVQSGAFDAESVRWVSVRELATMLRVSTSTVYQAVAAGQIPHVRVSNAIRIAVPRFTSAGTAAEAWKRACRVTRQHGRTAATEL
jgi:excisionase family DNA binding protein